MNYYTADSLDAVMPARVRNEQIWHYTSSAGVLGLLRTGGLWVSSARTLNDSGEIAFGSELITTRWIQTQDNYRNPRVIESFLREGERSRQQDIFVACASTVGDSLSQFRAYGSYAIGINAGVPLRANRDRAGDDTFGFSSPSDLDADQALTNGWRPVLYDTASQNDLIDAFLSHLDDICESWSEPSAEEEDETNSEAFAYSVAASQFVAVAAYLKHEAFSDEHEVRLFAQVSLANPAVQMRDGRLGLTPYLVAEPDAGLGETPQFRSMLTAARIGPGTVDPEAAFEGLSMALSKYEIDVPVTPLEIPFR